ncbi:MAG: 2-oxoglutarate dehydrogenase complex dihydrolipoyllysine-residue succinyltransferase [Verrucomicrobiota bacterium JB022]|nr:2-oxoglutarate dehydrogenase complex dihydrolipoyllysine-residue succinyltransferase [Verrucomicrobiota bacterium JB022]
MATEVKIPALGESISSGILATWHVQDGDMVEAGQTLYDLETDKITSEGTAEVAGKITLKAAEGDEVEIGAVVAEIDESASGGDSKAKDEGAKQEPSTSEKEPVKAESDSPEQKAVKQGGNEHQSPAVRRIAEESGVDPKGVDGSGKGGRVTKGDMLEAVERKGSAPEKAAKADAPAPKPAAPKPSAGERQTRKKMTPLRKTIAKRLVEATQETAMLTTFNEVNMEPVMTLRKTHQDAFVKQHGVKLGFMSFFTKAVVHALKAVPEVNAQIEGDEVVTNHYYDIGLAMSTPRGLMVPVVRDADQKSFAQIEQDILDYAKKAKDGKITIEDLQGGVFTITNGGIFGSMLSTPIINRPQSAILGMHNIVERPMAENGQVVIRPMMYVALSYDHRQIDGKEAVTFLVKVKQAIEDPTRLLFGI